MTAFYFMVRYLKKQIILLGLKNRETEMCENSYK